MVVVGGRQCRHTARQTGKPAKSLIFTSRPDLAATAGTCPVVIGCGGLMVDMSGQRWILVATSSGIVRFFSASKASSA